MVIVDNYNTRNQKLGIDGIAVRILNRKESFG